MLHRWFGELKSERKFAFLIVAGTLVVGCNPPEKGAIKLQGTKEEQTEKLNNPFGTAAAPGTSGEDKLIGPKGQEFKSIKNRGASK